MRRLFVGSAVKTVQCLAFMAKKRKLSVLVDASGGTVHDVVPHDLRLSLATSAAALVAWEDITPLARNEFICWVESAVKAETRSHRIERVNSALEEGKRRPCCWPGCKHR